MAARRKRALLTAGNALALVVFLVVAAPAARSATDIAVTSATDDADGDTSSVAALRANPGPDGTVSLREAIQATNNDPGQSTVVFDPSLKGSTISVGAVGGDLPPLTGGGLSIDGDIDADGLPDITLVDVTGDPAGFGLDIISSGNELHALALQGFATGVLFAASALPWKDPLPTDHTFSGNVVSGLNITGSTYGGIRIFPTIGHSECLRSACQTHNQWTDTQIIGNTIETTGKAANGIALHLDYSVGDAAQRLTIDGNVIHVAQTAGGITLSAGFGGGADANRIDHVVVAHNTIDAEAPSHGVSVVSGEYGGSANLAEYLTIDDNTIRFTGTPPVGSRDEGIAFAIGDGGCPSCPSPYNRPPKNDVVRNVQILGNVIEGSASGVLASDPCCGGPQRRRLTNVRIARNVIEGSILPHDLNPWGIEIGGDGVSSIAIVGNSIRQQAPGARSEYASRLSGGGIAVIGGLGMTGVSVHGVVISKNRLDTPLLGVSIVGGGPSDEPAAGDSTGNRIHGVTLLDNTIVHAPVLATRWNRRVKGITVIGGLGGPRPRSGNWRRSAFNSVTCIRLKGNVVVGKPNAVAVFANLGAGASRNTARLAGC